MYMATLITLIIWIVVFACVTYGVWWVCVKFALPQPVLWLCGAVLLIILLLFVSNQLGVATAPLLRR